MREAVVPEKGPMKTQGEDANLAQKNHEVMVLTTMHRVAQLEHEWV